MSKSKKIGIIGSGNLAGHLIRKLLLDPNMQVSLYGRNKKTVNNLAQIGDLQILDSLNSFSDNFDIIILAVNDLAIKQVSKLFNSASALVIHCSGTQSIDLLQKHHSFCGICWPLQTFSQGRKIDWDEVPLVLEANAEKSRSRLMEFANLLSKNVHFMNQDDRLRLHLAAVYACNFSNHMFEKASRHLNSPELFNLLKPLITETAAKVLEMTPHNAQTGPAVREDTITMEMHKSILPSEEKDFYDYLSNDILKTHKSKYDEL